MSDGDTKLVMPLALCAGFLGLIQGVAWTVLSILCICCYFRAISHDIAVDIDVESEVSYHDVIYQMFLNPDNNATSSLQVTPKTFSIFMWFYMFLSFFWIIISANIIWAMIRDKWLNTKYLFSSWAGFAIAISIVDVVLTALLGWDYDKYTDNDQYASISNFNILLVACGIVMTIAARGYTLWVVNVIFAVILIKFAIKMTKPKREENMSIIYGYQNNSLNPPWFENSSPAKDTLWPNLHLRNEANTRTYDNRAFESNEYVSTPTSNVKPTEPTSFADAIAEKFATIGKNKGKRSPLNNVRSPIIPEPDYTPPGTANGLKSVLRSTSHYNN